MYIPFLTKSKPKPDPATERYNFVQGNVNRKYITSKLREAFDIIVAEKIAEMKAPRFKVGEVVRVVCLQENFFYGWVCLGPPFTVGQDEQGEIVEVGTDSSLLHECVVEDYRNSSFVRTWDRNHTVGLTIVEVEAPDFVDTVRTFAKDIAVEHEYKIKFENPAINVRWGFQEQFLDYPMVMQGA
jgi:hypothetical protein